LAKAVRAHPTWRFELVVAPSEISAEAAREWSPADTARRVAEAKELAVAGHGEAALLLAWATCEAAARALAVREGVNVQRWSPNAMFRQLVHAGLLDGDDLGTVEQARQARNRLTHGLSSDVDEAAEIATRLLQVVDGLLVELVTDREDERAALTTDPFSP
jgi:hypothetical protein